MTKKKKKYRGIKLSELLTLTCGHDTPGDDHRWQKQPWTNILENEAAHGFWSDIWPRLLLRLLYLRQFTKRHTRKRWRYRSEIDYQSNGDPFGDLQREHFLYTDINPLIPNSHRMFVTNIGSILKDGWLETKAVLIFLFYFIWKTHQIRGKIKQGNDG